MQALSIDKAGWLVAGPGVEICPSPHFDERPAEDLAHLNTVVLHNISLPAGCFSTGVVRRFFCGTLDFDAYPELEDIRNLRVSSHFLVTRDGRIEQFVSCLARAWHAGVSRFNGRTRCNDFTIGIEIEGTDFVPFESVQYDVLKALLVAVDARFSLEYIVGHSDIAPGRKTDPGPCFDWPALMREAERFGSPQFPGAAAQMSLSPLQPTGMRV